MKLPKHMYHATARKHLPSIQSQGLLPSLRPYHEEEGEKFVYLADTHDTASHWGDYHCCTAGYEDMIVIAVDVSQLDVSKIGYDRNILEDLAIEFPNRVHDDAIGCFEYAGVIPWSVCQIVEADITG